LTLRTGVSAAALDQVPKIWDTVALTDFANDLLLVSLFPA
jgi:hypothetical protein